MNVRLFQCESKLTKLTILRLTRKI